jgi:CPA1 family monovalent cation:H+ antiporter
VHQFLTSAVGLLVAAIVVAQIARRLALPYTVGLVIAGVVLAVARVNIGVPLTHDLIYNIVLPPLLFEAALNIHWRELRRDLLPVLTLAVFGTVISAAVVAAGMAFFLHWPVPQALVFGVLIAATDPVAVIALFKDNGITGRLRLMVESESLFNDGVAAVLFALVIGAVQSDGGQATLGVGGTALALSTTVGGGLVFGSAVGGIATFIAGRITDHLVEGALTTVAAYGSFLLAERFSVSGVLASVAAGLVMGNLGILSEDMNGASPLRSREFVLALWEFIAFIANSLVFLLIGMAVAGIAFDRIGPADLSSIIVLILVGRALTVYPLCLLFRGTSWSVPLREQHILWWGGLRGALGLALALSLPATLAMRDDILIAAFGVVVFSVVAQGLTMPALLRALGIAARKV